MNRALASITPLAVVIGVFFSFVSMRRMPVVAVKGLPTLQAVLTRQTRWKAHRVSCSCTEEERGRQRCVDFVVTSADLTQFSI